jgi:hypothetical protein
MDISIKNRPGMGGFFITYAGTLAGDACGDIMINFTPY